MTVPLETTPRWPDTLLDPMRQEGDPAADHVVAALFADGQVGVVNDLMATLVRNDDLAAEALPPIVREYLASTEVMPSWANPEMIEAGERVFWRYGPGIIAILFCYSLPFCYAARKGVQVLALTSRLYSNPTRRIIETAQMVIDVMRPDGLGELGTGIRTAQKVRLMHGAVRLLISRSDLWKAEFDKPINQEDMAGTLISFSWVVLDGLRRLGYDITDQEAEAYLHCWKVVGHIMGIREEMQAQNMADAEALARRIQARQYAACEEGQMMTKALAEMLQYYLPGELLDGLPATFIRYFLGDANADLLGVAAADLTQSILRPAQMLAQIKGRLVHESDELARVHEVLGRALVQGLLFAGRGPKGVPFRIPNELLQTWGINWLP